MLFQNIIPKLNIGVLGCSSDLESLMSLPSVRFVSIYIKLFIISHHELCFIKFNFSFSRVEHLNSINQAIKH